jgi:hypothetical protein
MPAGIPVTALGCFQRWHCLASVLAFAGVLSLAGCEQDAAIVVENVPKDTAARAGALKPTPPTDRMLAAIVPHDKAAYFFKLTGPIDETAALPPQFLDFLRSLRFDNGEPKWTLPAGWTQEDGGTGRIATLHVPGDPPLSLAVSSLRLPEDGLDEYLLANVNRWRGQLGLAALTAERFNQKEDPKEEIFRFKLEDGTPVTLVDFIGKFSGGMTAPFAVQGGQSSPPSSSSPKPELAYELPPGWEAAAGDGVSTAAFTSGGTRTTITALPASNDLLANINRWRAQVGLTPIEQGDLDEAVKKIKLGDDRTGDYVTLEGPPDGESPKSIVGVIAVRDDTAWFVKMMGDSQAVQKKKAAFEAFVKSLRFSRAEQ